MEPVEPVEPVEAVEAVEEDQAVGICRAACRAASMAVEALVNL
jgi:hypothetical protein